MTNGAIAAAAAVAGGSVVANAIRTTGPVIRVESSDFEAVLRKVEAPLVVYSQSGLFSTRYQYLTTYKGLYFHTKTATALSLSPGVEIVNTKKLLLPG